MYHSFAPRAILAILLCCLSISACSSDATGPGGTPGGGSGGTPGGGSGGAPGVLAFTLQPAADWATKPMLAVTVTAKDSTGRQQTAFNGTVTLTLSGGTANAALTGTRTMQAVHGVAAFADVAVDRSGVGYQLTASADGLTAVTSQAFDVRPTPHLAFTAVPSSYRTDQPMSPAVQVTLQDSTGAAVESFGGTITVSVSSGGGVALLGTLQATASHGVAVFSNITLPAEGTAFVLKAESPFTIAGTSAPLVSAPSLKFDPVPPGVPSATTIAPGIQVALRSASGAIMNTFTDPVTLALVNNVTGAVLGGTTTVQAVAGVATFADLSVSQPGAFDLRATTAGYMGATSSTITAVCVLDCWVRRTPRTGVLGGPGAAEGVLNGKLYVAGGLDENYDDTNMLQVYDPATNFWQQLAPMEESRYGARGAAVGGRFYVIGGYDDAGMSRAVTMYDPTTNAWTLRAPMPEGRDDFGVAVVGGRIYVVGGSQGSLAGADFKLLSSTLVYDPATDSWAAGPAMTRARAGMGVTQIGGLIVVAGGRVTLGGGATDAVELLDPVSETWTTGTSLPESVGSVTMVASDAALYVGGLYDDTYGNPLVIRYDVAARTWSTTKELPSQPPHPVTGMAIVGETLYALRGAELWSYTPLP